jgi:hypothetical protein
MLNTILYNSNEGIDNEVNRRLRNTPTATTILPIGPSVKDNVGAITPNNDAIFDQEIDLITEGIDSFMATNLRELPKDNALTIAKYIVRRYDRSAKLEMSTSYVSSCWNFLSIPRDNKQFISSTLMTHPCCIDSLLQK